ncbi:MAG TPA: response regulator, partial [Rhodanobacteraceae bacterium]|nr:response regulator [Rhodanobacteraceae bacterium]
DTSASRGERILLVEDDDLVRTHALRLLESLGYQVTAARNGPEALEMLRKDVPCDLLFTDVIMPGGMTGPQLAAAARELRPGLPVLYTSGYTENAIVHHGRVDPGVNLLHKPYRRPELAAKIRAALSEEQFKDDT